MTDDTDDVDPENPRALGRLTGWELPVGFSLLGLGLYRLTIEVSAEAAAGVLFASGGTIILHRWELRRQGRLREVPHTDDSEDSRDVAQLRDSIPGAGPQEIAGGVAAAISDSRNDFHEIRNAVMNAEGVDEARRVVANNLTPAEVQDLIIEVQTQQRLRENFTETAPEELCIGQKVLIDTDRPYRGVVNHLEADGTVWIQQKNRDVRSKGFPEDVTIFADPNHVEQQE